MLQKGDVSDLADAVRKVAAGEAEASLALTVKALSPRENEVLRLAGEGLTSKAIAERLFVSEGTVYTYFHRLLVKLHLNSRALAIAYMKHHGS